MLVLVLLNLDLSSLSVYFTNYFGIFSVFSELVNIYIRRIIDVNVIIDISDAIVTFYRV